MHADDLDYQQMLHLCANFQCLDQLTDLVGNLYQFHSVAYTTKKKHYYFVVLSVAYLLQYLRSYGKLVPVDSSFDN